ncbi:MAG: glycosyltransferase [Ruminococcus sp.]|nr:glycosyltransferase [Ruminococcus sp.]
MKVVYVSDYLTIHLKSLAEELYKILGDDFSFIETVEPHSESKEKTFNRGFAYFQASELTDESIPWRYRAYGGQAELEKCLKLIDNSDAVIIGNANDIWIKSRLRKNKLTFRAHERWYRKELPWYRIPKALIGGWLHHGRFRNLYMLCASAYTAVDVRKVKCFKNKIYRWGYFPEKKSYYDIDPLFSKKVTTSILWVGREIWWKHPEYAIIIAEKLKASGYSFEINLLGIDENSQKLSKMIVDKKVTDCVHLLGSKNTQQVREYMEKAGIYLFTSDRNEGWGVVLNEAMNSGCAVVAGNEIGAVPFLIENEKNGLIFESDNLDMLYEKVKYLLDNADKQRKIGERAYRTIEELWNAEIAAKRFICLAEKIISGDKYPDLYETGPCSIAK